MGGRVRLQRSERVTEELRRVMPGGDTRTSTFFTPFPIVLERGEGHRVWDVDGNAYIDLLNNYTSLVHGHAHPRIVAAVVDQAGQGFCFSAPHRSQAELAARITDRVESVEHLRFTNSGTEAVMQAVRAARAATGRTRIVKAHGGYHGSWEQVPMVLEEAIGTPPAVGDLITWVDYNDVAGLERAMAEGGSDVAAIILEPVLGGGGIIAASAAFLAAARRLATQHGALLILDEVITARLDRGGYQRVLGVRPDLTTFGKIIGGGLPVGAVGGSAEAMAVFDPRRPGHIDHGGTFNGNPMTMVAGCASVDLLDDAAIATLNELGSRLAEGLARCLEHGPVPGTVTSAGSLVQIHLGTTGPIRSWADVDLATPLLDVVHRACLEEGVYFARRGMLNVSTAMDDAVVDDVIRRFACALDRAGPALHDLGTDEHPGKDAS